MRNRKSLMLFVVLFQNVFLLLEQGHILFATVLLKNGANVNAKMNAGSTPLSLAKAKGHARMVELLKANGSK